MPVLNLPSVLTPFTGGEHTLPAIGSTVGEALDDVVRRFPALSPRLRDERGEPYPFVTIYLNDEDIRFTGGFDTPVQNTDELSIVPAVAGG
ncbi:MAG TPA: MoaD/ThiS family protein [Gemmatimonadaceae bacterium]